MKQLMLLPLLSMGAMTGPQKQLVCIHSANCITSIARGHEGDDVLNLGSQPEPGAEKMSAAVFKAQKYCRAELKDFEFDARFDIISVTVYFAGANFQTAAKATLNSSSLAPISAMMAKCVPGTIVIFDDVKVKGPDNQLRSIPGLSLVLR